MTPEDRFEELVDTLAQSPDVTPPTGGAGFGKAALRAQNKIFAMFVRGRLVVKLPKERVAALVDGGHGMRFDANKGTPMKEWLALDPGSDLAWSALAQEALEFVRGDNRRSTSTGVTCDMR